MGGLARKSTVIENSKEQGFNTIILDAGNLFFKQDKIDPGISLDIAKENAHTVVEAFNLISCDAFSPGPKDFASGLTFLKELFSKSAFDYVSCNIKDKNLNLLFNPYKIIDNDGFKIGIIGASSIFESEGVIVEEPYSAINNIVSEIQEESDCIILLFNSSDLDYRKINQSNLNVDLIIRGNTRRKSADGGSGKVPIYSTGDRGKVLYQFDLKYTSNSPLTDVAYFEKMIRLDNKRMSDIISSSGENKLSLGYKENIQKYSQAINNAENSLQYKRIELNKTIADNPYVLKIVDEGKAKTQTMGSPILDPHRFHNH